MNAQNLEDQVPAEVQERAKKEDYFGRSKYSPRNAVRIESVVSIWLIAKAAQEKIRQREIELYQQRYGVRK